MSIERPEVSSVLKLVGPRRWVRFGPFEPLLCSHHAVDFAAHGTSRPHRVQSVFVIVRETPWMMLPSGLRCLAHPALRGRR